jgi:hypothetical protein
VGPCLPAALPLITRRVPRNLPVLVSSHEPVTDRRVEDVLLRRARDSCRGATEKRWCSSGDFLVLSKNFKHEDEGASPKMAKRLEGMLSRTT